MVFLRLLARKQHRSQVCPTSKGVYLLFVLPVLVSGRCCHTPCFVSVEPVRFCSFSEIFILNKLFYMGFCQNQTFILTLNCAGLPTRLVRLDAFAIRVV